MFHDHRLLFKTILLRDPLFPVLSLLDISQVGFRFWGNYTPAPFVEGTEISPQASDDLIPRFSCPRAATYRNFPSSRCTSPVIFTLPSISPVYAGAGLGRRSSISLGIFRNRSLGTATSANWNVTYRPWQTAFRLPGKSTQCRAAVLDICLSGIKTVPKRGLWLGVMRRMAEDSHLDDYRALVSAGASC